MRSNVTRRLVLTLSLLLTLPAASQAQIAIGAAGYDITFLHPKANEQFPIAGEGVLNGWAGRATYRCFRPPLPIYMM